MAKLYSCDRCRAQVPDEDESRVEWTHLALAKVVTPLAPFQVMDLCPNCTDIIRRELANPAGARTVDAYLTPRCTCSVLGRVDNTCPLHGVNNGG